MHQPLQSSSSSLSNQITTELSLKTVCPTSPSNAVQLTSKFKPHSSSFLWLSLDPFGLSVCSSFPYPVSALVQTGLKWFGDHGKKQEGETSTLYQRVTKTAQWNHEHAEQRASEQRARIKYKVRACMWVSEAQCCYQTIGRTPLAPSAHLSPPPLPAMREEEIKP